MNHEYLIAHLVDEHQRLTELLEAEHVQVIEARKRAFKAESEVIALSNQINELQTQSSMLEGQFMQLRKGLQIAQQTKKEGKTSHQDLRIGSALCMLWYVIFPRTEVFITCLRFGKIWDRID